MSIFDTLKKDIDLSEHIKSCGVDVKGRGDGEYKALCPLHEDKKTESLSITYRDGTWLWKCFGCDKGGSIVDWEMEFSHINRIQAADKLCKRYGLDSQKPKTKHISKKRLKNECQEYLRNCLIENQEVRNILLERDITPKDIEKWGIGYSDGNVYSYFKEKYDSEFNGPDGAIPALIEAGIAADRNGNIYGVFQEGVLTVPVYFNGHISHWDLRNPAGGAHTYQHTKDVPDKGCYFFQQENIHKDRFALVEGVFDAISLEKEGVSAVAYCGYSKEKIKFLQNQIGINENFDELTEKREILLFADRDEGGGGQTQADKIARSLCDYYDVTLYYLPMGNDIDDYLRDGGKIDDLKLRHVPSGNVEICEQNSRYWYLPKSDDPPYPISNCIIERKYTFKDELGHVRHEVDLVGPDCRVGPVPIDSTDFSNSSRFKEWIGKYGDFAFTGSSSLVDKIITHIFKTQNSQEVEIYNKYGRIKDLWLMGNAAMKKGKIYGTNEDNIITVDNRYVKSMYAETSQINYELKDEKLELDEIIETLLGLYPSQMEPMMFWWIIGLATSIFYHSVIRDKFMKFPVIAMYGDTERGKSAMALTIAHLFGCNERTVVVGGKNSTSKGVARLLASMSNIPVIVNEYKHDFNGLVRAIYDGDTDFKGMKTIDDSVSTRNYESSIIATMEDFPRERSVVNRLIPISFWSYQHDGDQQYTRRKFNSFFNSMNLNGSGITFIQELDKTNGHEVIIEKIREGLDIISSGHEISARRAFNLSVLYSGIQTAIDVLNLDDVFANIRKRMKERLDKGIEDKGEKNWVERVLIRARIPREEQFSKSISGLVKTGKKLIEEESYANKFFSIVSTIWGNNNYSIEKYFETEVVGDDIKIYMIPGKAYGEARTYDNRTERFFDRNNITKRDVLAHIRSELDYCKSNTLRTVTGNAEYTYIMKGKELLEKYGVNFE